MPKIPANIAIRRTTRRFLRQSATNCSIIESHRAFHDHALAGPNSGFDGDGSPLLIRDLDIAAFERQSETSTKTLVASFVIRSADVGTISRDIAGAAKLASANMLGLSILSRLSNAMRTLLRRVSDSTTSLTNRTLPSKTSSGYER